jgi:GAF domain-containing protein
MTEEVTGPGFTELQHALLGSHSIEQFLQELAELAARLVTGSLCCSMTLRSAGGPVTAACTSQVASRVDEVQYQLDDGPCLHAMRHGHLVRIEDTEDQAQWPKFEEQAATHGIRSCLALPLVADGKPVGALNLYACVAGAFGAAETRRAENFAENASGALALALRLASYAALTDQMRSSLASRSIIDQAIGVIMAQERCTQARAFAMLRAVSQNGNVKLRDLAAAIVTSVSGEVPQPSPPFEDG